MKLIAIDMDGTLLNEQGQISSENRAALLLAQQQGHIVSIATGRAYQDAQAILNRTGLRMPMITSNGASVFAADGSRLFQVPLPHEIVSQVLQFETETGLYMELYTERTTYTTAGGRDLLYQEMEKLLASEPELEEARLWSIAEKQFLQAGVQEVPDVAQVLVDGEMCLKVLAFSFDRARIARMASAVRQLSGVEVSASTAYNMEVTHEQAQKGIALRQLAAFYGVSMEQTVAIGDNHNDLSMLRVAGLSIAMGNAQADIQSHCHHVSKTNEEHGVAHALTSFVGVQA